MSLLAQRSRVALLALVALPLTLLGCPGSTPDPVTPDAASAALRVGQTRAEAEGILVAEGARLSTSTDTLGAASAGSLEDRAVFGLADGSLLQVLYGRSSADEPFRVQGFTICRDPSRPKGLRVWEDLDELRL